MWLAFGLSLRRPPLRNVKLVNLQRAAVRNRGAGSIPSVMAQRYNQLQSYEAPSWAKSLGCLPDSFVQLAVRPTPIHRWDLPGVPKEFQVFIKRDDMTGSTLGGNKVRKLEFLMADALHKGCDSVVTCGSIQSNHARATAVAAAQLGMKPHLVLRWRGPIDPDAVDCSGNVLLDRFVGAKIILVPPLNYEGSVVDGVRKKGLKHKMIEYMERLKSEGSKPYLIPVGGSNTVGLWGYIEAFKELMEQVNYYRDEFSVESVDMKKKRFSLFNFGKSLLLQGVLEDFDDLILAVGSGGSAGGLAIANYLTGSKIRIHAICVSDNADYFYGHIDDTIAELSLPKDPEGKPTVRARDIIDVIEGYKGQGYGRSTDEELAQSVEISARTGIILDPVYTLKGVRGMLTELQKNPGRFKGKRILYIHTGGVFGAYDGRYHELLKRNPVTNQVFSHVDVVPD